MRVKLVRLVVVVQVAERDVGDGVANCDGRHLCKAQKTSTSRNRRGNNGSRCGAR